MYSIRHIDVGRIANRDVFLLHHRIMYSIRHIDIGRVAHRDVFRLRHRLGKNSSVMHSIRHIDVGRVANRDVFLLHHRIMYGIRHIDVGRIANRDVFRLRHRLGKNGGVMHGVRHFDIGRVVYTNRVDPDGRRSGLGSLTLLALGELSAEGDPYGVAGMQGMDVHMGDGIVALHPIGPGDSVDRLSFLDDVDVVLAPVHHLLLSAHPDRSGTGLLGPGGKARQQQCQYQK